MYFITISRKTGTHGSEIARRAEAALMEAGLKQGPSVSVSEPGKILLAGFVREGATKTRAEEVLKGVKGVQSVDSQIRVSQVTARFRYNG